MRCYNPRIQRRLWPTWMWAEGTGDEKHLPPRLPAKNNEKIDGHKVYLAFGHAGRIVSDSSRTNGARRQCMVQPGEIRHGQVCCRKPIIEICALFNPRSNHPDFFVFLSYYYFFLPSFARCIMIVQMRAARGLPGSFRNPSPWSFVVNPCAPASAQREYTPVYIYII